MKVYEGEKTMTFTVTDALLSPLGLAVLTGAGFAEENDVKHVHVTYDVELDADGKAKFDYKRLANELGVGTSKEIFICNDEGLRPNALILDNNGAIIDWADEVTFNGTPGTLSKNSNEKDLFALTEEQEVFIEVKKEGQPAKNALVKLDFYCVFTNGATEITIEPNDFGGSFYVEADTLYRNQDGKDMAASLTFPKVKIQSAFTLSMSPTGRFDCLAV